MSDVRQEELRQRLLSLGFDVVRFVSATAALGERPLRAWLESGMQADMHWMERSADNRADPRRVLEGARSILVLGVNYAAAGAQPRPGPRWAKYALHEDYHDTIKPALVAAGRVLEEIFGITSRDYRYYTDTGPVLEREWAARAGLGFIGKNAMLISREHGNWLLLSAILTRVEFGPDEPLRRTLAPEQQRPAGGVGLLCGKCTRCLDACPTAAFAAPGVLDARRCISYQTIENRGIIPRDLREGIGDHVFGCDVCLEVCPWNRFAREGRQMLLVARRELQELSVAELLAMTPDRFATVFRRTPIKRLKLAGLLRNACVVAGNSGDVSLVPQLVSLAAHPISIVRAHAVWAVVRLAGPQRASELLIAERSRETDAQVLAEYELADRARGAG